MKNKFFLLMVAAICFFHWEVATKMILSKMLNPPYWGILQI